MSHDDELVFPHCPRCRARLLANDKEPVPRAVFSPHSFMAEVTVTCACGWKGRAHHLELVAARWFDVYYVNERGDERGSSSVQAETIEDALREPWDDETEGLVPARAELAKMCSRCGHPICPHCVDFCDDLECVCHLDFDSRCLVVEQGSA